MDGGVELRTGGNGARGTRGGRGRVCLSLARVSEPPALVYFWVAKEGEWRSGSSWRARCSSAPRRGGTTAGVAVASRYCVQDLMG